MVWHRPPVASIELYALFLPIPLDGLVHGTVNKRIRRFALRFGVLLNALLVALGDAKLDFIGFLKLIFSICFQLRLRYGHINHRS